MRTGRFGGGARATRSCFMLMDNSGSERDFLNVFVMIGAFCANADLAA